MTYREGDEELSRRSEAEIAAREALAPLAAEGRARRAGQGGAALVLVSRAVEMLPAREIDHELEVLPVRTVVAMSRALSPPAAGDMLKAGGATLIALTGLLLVIGTTSVVSVILLPLILGIAGALATSSSVFRVHREVSWVRSLPFPVRGYYDTFVRDGAAALEIDVEVRLPDDDLQLVFDLIDRARGEVPVRSERVAGGLRLTAVAAPQSLLVGFRRALLDEVLVPLHALHPISRVRLRWLQAGRVRAEGLG